MRFSALTCTQVIAFTILLQSCGEGSESSNSTTPSDTSNSPTTSSITTQGVITGFGSVFVNGVKFETDSVEVESDDQPAVETDLKVGQIITLTGTINADGVTGTADRITQDDQVEGPISNNNPLTVLGRTIVVNDATVFDDSITAGSVAGLEIGDVIEVSGFINANDEIVATLIESKSPGGEYELVGEVMGLMNEQSTFRIGAQTVEFSSAVFEDFDGGAVIKNGDLVEVKGSVVNNSDWLIADEVELEDNDLAETDEFEIEGLITDLTSSEAFNVLGHPVTTNPSTTTFDGGTASELAIDVKVEVEGTVVDDVLVATKVEFKKVEDTRFEAVVDTKNEDLNQLTVLGVTFKVTANTQMEDDSDFRVTSFGLDDISDGDFVEIRGKLEADGTVTVTRLERDDLDDETSVRGNVQSNEDDILVIAGVTIVTTSQTEYRDSLDMSIDKATFFAAALFGVEVDAEGQETDTNQITATELQLEDDD